MPAHIPAISVIVPIFGVEIYLPDCLRSIADQTFKDFEVILVDDASQDRSGEIASAFAETDDRFTYIRQDARGPGPGGGRNGGLPTAKGRWVIFIDADDVMEPDMLERMYQAGEAVQADLVTCNTIRLVGSSVRRSEFHDLSHPVDVACTTAAESPWLILDSTPWNKLFLRTFFDAVIGAWPEKVLYEDIAAMTRAHMASSATAVIADHLYYWRIRVDGGAITQATTKITGDQEQLRELRNAATEIKGGNGYRSSAGLAQITEAETSELLHWFQWKAYCFDLHWMLRKLPRCTNDDARTLAEDMATTMQVVGSDVLPMLSDRNKQCFDYLLARDERRWRAAASLLNGRLFSDGRALSIAKTYANPEAVLLNVVSAGPNLALTVSVPSSPPADAWRLLWGERSLVGSAAPEPLGVTAGACQRSLRPGRNIVRFDLPASTLPETFDVIHLAVQHDRHLGQIGRSLQDRLRSRIDQPRSVQMGNASVVPFFDNNRLFLARNAMERSVISSEIANETITFTLAAAPAEPDQLTLHGVHQHQPIALTATGPTTWQVELREVLDAYRRGAGLLFLARSAPDFPALPRPVRGQVTAQTHAHSIEQTETSNARLNLDVMIATQGQLVIRVNPKGGTWVKKNFKRLQSSGYIPGL